MASVRQVFALLPLLGTGAALALGCAGDPPAEPGRAAGGMVPGGGAATTPSGAPGFAGAGSGGTAGWSAAIGGSAAGGSAIGGAADGGAAEGGARAGGGVGNGGGGNGGGGNGGVGNGGRAGVAGTGGVASSAGAAGGSMGGAAGALVPIFLAQGAYGRTTVSCDDGQSFIHNHSQDDSYLCFSDANHDCDHSEFAARGLAYGANAFIATWGWGHPGTLQRSTDGVTWTEVLSNSPTFAGLAYGNGRFVADANPPSTSVDGKAWQNGGALSFDFNYRGIGFVPAGGGTFIVTGESTERAISYSHDGQTWKAATVRPDACAASVLGVVGNSSVAIVASAQGQICVSKDAGDTWQLVPITDSFSSPPVWSGSEFMIYSNNQLWRSANGESWSATAIEPANIAIGSLARGDNGTFVASNAGWQVWYEKQQIFRSTDGVHWQILASDHFVGSHPINFIAYGYVAPGAGCPAR